MFLNHQENEYAFYDIDDNLYLLNSMKLEIKKRSVTVFSRLKSSWVEEGDRRAHNNSTTPETVGEQTCLLPFKHLTTIYKPIRGFNGKPLSV